MSSKSFIAGVGRAFRETGQALDRAGLRATGDTSFREKFSRHRQIMNLFNKRPYLANDSFVAPCASVIGDVTIGDKSSVMYGSVVRGDLNAVYIGAVTNVQDRVVITTAKSLDSGFPATVTIGNFCSIGHGAVLHSCSVLDQARIGMGAVLEEGSLVESGSIVEAGSVLPAGARVPPGQLWAGNPAAFVRDLDEDEVGDIAKHATAQADAAAEHAAEFLPYGQAYLDAERIKAEGGSL
jgi:gamma-carbonic anhydrase